MLSKWKFRDFKPPFFLALATKNNKCKSFPLERKHIIIFYQYVYAETINKVNRTSSRKRCIFKSRIRNRGRPTRSSTPLKGCRANDSPEQYTPVHLAQTCRAMWNETRSWDFLIALTCFALTQQQCNSLADDAIRSLIVPVHDVLKKSEYICIYSRSYSFVPTGTHI